MHEMRTVTINDPGVCLSVCQTASCIFAVQKRPNPLFVHTEMADQIAILFALETQPRAHWVTSFFALVIC